MSTSHSGDGGIVPAEPSGVLVCSSLLPLDNQQAPAGPGLVCSLVEMGRANAEENLYIGFPGTMHETEITEQSQLSLERPGTSIEWLGWAGLGQSGRRPSSLLALLARNKAHSVARQCDARVVMEVQ